MKHLLILTACLVLASCSDPFTAPQEIVIGDSVAKTCNPQKPPKTEGACNAAGGVWSETAILGPPPSGNPEDPWVIIGYEYECICPIG